jgi:hypothetical protein
MAGSTTLEVRLAAQQAGWQRLLFVLCSRPLCTLSHLVECCQVIWCYVGAARHGGEAGCTAA